MSKSKKIVLHLEKRMEAADAIFIHNLRAWIIPVARAAIFIVYFWFGLLKVISLSPANPLVAALLARTLPIITFDHFIIIFGMYEMIIGVTFLIPGLERSAIALLIPHLLATVMPLFVLPAVAWQAPLVPTLEGQYMIKNVLIIALAIVIAAHLHPMHLYRQSSKKR